MEMDLLNQKLLMVQNIKQRVAPPVTEQSPASVSMQIHAMDELPVREAPPSRSAGRGSNKQTPHFNAPRSTVPVLQ